MSGWYKITLSNAEFAAGKGVELQNAFTDVFLGLAGPDEAGMFACRQIGKHDYFFSPGAVRIAKPIIDLYAGVECATPKLSELTSLIATVGAAKVHFAPEE